MDKEYVGKKQTHCVRNIFCMALISVLSQKLKEYLVPGYKLNNLLSNYAFERHKLEEVRSVVKSA